MSYRTKLGARIPLSALIQALAVAEYSSFRRAAFYLGTCQSSVSSKIKKLEEELGIAIFERLPRGVRTTEAGRHFLAQIRESIDHLNHTITTAGSISEGKNGTLRIGLYSPIHLGFLNSLLHNFRLQNPSINLHFTEGNAQNIIKSVREQMLDVAFVLGSPSIDDCHSRPLWHDKLMVAIPQDHRLLDIKNVHWSDLSKEKFIIQKNGIGPQFYGIVAERLNKICHRPSIERTDVSRDILLGMVAKGCGITPTSGTVAKLQFPGLMFLPLSDEPSPLIFSAVWSVYNSGTALRRLLLLAQTEMRRSGLKS